MADAPKIIVLTTYRRPDYTARVVSALERCEGVHEYLVLFHCEPGHPEVLRAVESCNLRKEVFVNHSRLGCTTNVFAALNDGFRRSGYVIALEDDTVPAGDFLVYMEWAGLRYRTDKSVFMVTAYNRSDPDSRHWPTGVRRDQWFSPWGWATWGDRFAEMSRHWPLGRPQSWDQWVNRMRAGRCQVKPCLSRTQNIGALDGEYVPDPEWHAANQFNPIWAGDGVEPPVHGFFREI